jgi:hypothetical protein
MFSPLTHVPYHVHRWHIESRKIAAKIIIERCSTKQQVQNLSASPEFPRETKMSLAIYERLLWATFPTQDMGGKAAGLRLTK